MIADKTAEENTERFVKEKILQDLYPKNYFNRFQDIIPSFKKITNYETLSLHELIFIWKEVEKSISKKQNNFPEDARKRSAFELMDNHCLNCDEYHYPGTYWCSAYGKICSKCGLYNHNAKCCLKNFIKDCLNCGSDHVQSKCPAFGKECPRCLKMNHFSWKCFGEVVSYCSFCGQSHINNRQRCPAVDSFCCKCNKKGHYAFKCQIKRRNFRRH